MNSDAGTTGVDGKRGGDVGSVVVAPKSFVVEPVALTHLTDAALAYGAVAALLAGLVVVLVAGGRHV